MGKKAASTVLNHFLTGATSYSPNPPPQSPYVKALTTTILNHLRLGHLAKAVSVLFAAPVSFPLSLYTHLFQICSKTKSIVEARKLESHLVSFNPNPPIFLLNRAIETYGKCGCLEDSRELFEEMPKRDGGSWNALITAYSRNGSPEEALDVFYSMHKAGIYASEVTFASVLGMCASVLGLWLSRQVHGLIVKYGFCGNVILESSLVDVYGKCRVMSDARRMFDEIENPNAISWNVIVRRYHEMGEGKEAVVMFFEMIRMNVRPLNFTVSNALVACSSFGGLREGAQIHGFSIKSIIEMDDVVTSSVIDMYVKCGDLGSARMIFELPSSKNLINWTCMVSGYAMSGRTKEARELFDEMPERNVISWNAMLAGYTRSFQWDEALELFHLMRKETRDIDYVTLGLVLNVSSALSDVQLGKQVHGYIYRHGLYNNSFVGNALLDMYGKCGNMRNARVWFYEMSHFRDNVSWNALLTSYARHRLSEEAMAIFWRMLGETIPSKYTFATLLAACANIFALEPGKQIHAFMIRNGYEIDIVLRGALIDMYCKCRRVEYALKVFSEEVSREDVILWNSMMLGCYHNRKREKVFELFELMEKEGIKPDNITLQALLLACMSEGHVELGRQIFYSMSTKYCIIPRLEHYESMIELYCQSGSMDDLEEFIKKMPFGPTVPMLSKVFDYSQKYRNLKLEKWAADQLNDLNPSADITI